MPVEGARNGDTSSVGRARARICGATSPTSRSTAHPPSVTYQLRAFTRRHRALVASGVLVVVVSVAAAIVSTLYAVEAGRSERLAHEETERAEKMFDTLLERSMDTNQKFVPQLMRLAGATPIVVEMTNANLEDLQSLEELAAFNPRARREIAAAYLRVGGVLGDPSSTTHVGERPAAMRAYERCVEIAKELHEEEPGDDESLYLYAVALGSLGYLQIYEEQPDAARSNLERALALVEQYCGRHEGEYRAGQTRARLHKRLAAAAHRRKDAEPYRRHVARHRELQEELFARYPQKPEAELELANALAQAANLEQNSGELASARATHTRALDIYERHHADNERDAGLWSPLIRSLTSTGALDSHFGDHAVATERLQRALDLLLEWQRTDPGNKRIPMQLVLARFALAESCVDFAKEDEAARPELQERARNEFNAILDYYKAKGRTHGGIIDNVRRRRDAIAR